MIYASVSIRKTAERGRGIFAEEAIPADTVVEVAPVVVMTNEDREHLDKTLLHDYIFEWGTDTDKCCMALGNIPIYNHSYESNCDYFMNYEDETIMINTVRDIAEGEELTINYNGDPADATPVWFDVK